MSRMYLQCILNVILKAIYLRYYNILTTNILYNVINRNVD